MADLSAALAARAPQTVFTYTLPEDVRSETGELLEPGLAGVCPFVQKSFGFIKLKMSAEIASAEKANGNQGKLAYGYVQRALVEVDGRTLNKGDGEDERVMENCDPVIRDMLMTAYADMTTAPAGAAKKLLASRSVRAG